MPAHISGPIDARVYDEWRSRYAELNLTKTELMRYTILISCGYSKENALALAKIKPASSEKISSLLKSQSVA